MKIVINCHNTASCFCVVPDSTKNPNLDMNRIERQSKPKLVEEHEEKLNPCPFCRCSVLVKSRGSFYSIYCPVCRCETSMIYGEEAAIKDWNSRTADP